jgi:hypothetical protein
LSVVTSGKVISVLAATAFVGAFRVQAGAGDTPEAANATLSGARVSALKNDAVHTAAAPAAAALGTVAALPALHRSHPAKPASTKVAAKKHKAHKTHKAAKKRKKHFAPRIHVTVRAAPKVATPPPVPVPTAAPTVAPVAPQRVYTPPAAPTRKTYVGKSFDSKG